MVLRIRGRIVPYMRLYHAIFSGRPLAYPTPLARIQSMNTKHQRMLALETASFYFMMASLLCLAGLWCYGLIERCFL